MQLFYNPDIDQNSTQVAFDKEESRHMVKVLRKAPGDLLEITNGKGWLFTARIVVADVKNCLAQLIESHFYEPRPFNLHLAVAPTKLKDRYEWFLEKATEIGVETITPIICEHSERKVIKTERYEKILQAAMKQSLHYYMPHLEAPVMLKDFLDRSFSGQKYMAHCEELERFSLKQKLQLGEDVLILIGPEGDFSRTEIRQALARQFIPVTLGSTRLRTETAALVACHTVALLNE